MLDIVPFAGIRYNATAVDLAAVTAPPYDVISPTERTALEQTSPYNVVRLILPRDGNSKYTQVRGLLDRWLAESVLARDPAPALYVYEERFRDGSGRRQRGILAAVTLSEEILPHELTMAPIVEDRLELLRATRANLSPVFCLYWASDPGAGRVMDRASRGEPFADFTSPDGVGHRAWRVEDPSAAEEVRAALAGSTVIIADGHHRYRTAMAYRAERRAADGAGPWDRMLLYLVDAERDSPVLLPIHRAVSGMDVAEALARLAGTFEIEPAPTDPEALAALVAERRAQGRCYGILGPRGAWIASLTDPTAVEDAMPPERCPAWRELDVSVLHMLVFDRLLGGPAVTYVHSAPEAAGAVASGAASFAVLLAPTPMGSVRAVAEAGETMPPKSTFFVPKPRTGIVIRPLD